MLGIIPVENSDYANIDKMSRVFHLDNAKTALEYNEFVPGYPVPVGIF